MSSENNASNRIDDMGMWWDRRGRDGVNNHGNWVGPCGFGETLSTITIY